MKKVLILGAGLVAQPIIRHLLKVGYSVTVASNTPDRAMEMVNNHPHGSIIDWNIEDKETLARLVESHDLAVSLLPYIYHLEVAKMCLQFSKNMVTTSYVKPEMQDYHNQAKELGILLLNEIGLDPGIDHMSAMKIIDHVHQKGGAIEEFYSICGALPAPESATNPLKYKFSWSPRGVLMAGNNDAMYLKEGHIVNIPTERLFRDIFSVEFPEVGMLDVYPNRNSTDYIDIYGIPEAKTVFRGTFRFKGWCETLDAMKILGLITSEKYSVSGLSFAGFLAKINGLELKADIKSAISEKLNIPKNSVAIEALEWLGWLSEDSLNLDETTPFDISANLMLDKMTLEREDRDMVVLQHTFTASYPDGKKEKIISRMLDFGSPSTDTAIARTVALPAAIAADLILKGKITTTGVWRPVVPDIYLPVLQELGSLGIKMEETFGLSL